MSWTKLDDRYPENTKTERASDAAFRLHVTCMCYASGNRTFGFIPAARMRMLASRWDDPAAVIRECVELGFFDNAEGGYSVHDYLQYNPGPEYFEAKSKGGTASAEKRWGSTPLTRVTPRASASVTAHETTREVTVPVPVPVPVNDDVAITRVPHAREDIATDVHPVYGLMDDTATPEDIAFRTVAGIVETHGNTYAERGLLDIVRQFSDGDDVVVEARRWQTKFGGQYDTPGKRVSSYHEWMKVARRIRLEGPAYRGSPNGHSPPALPAAAPVTPDDLVALRKKFGDTYDDSRN